MSVAAAALASNAHVLLCLHTTKPATRRSPSRLARAARTPGTGGGRCQAGIYTDSCVPPARQCSSPCRSE
eukprot:3024963-Lingulodinium_polyedra.AAC.1